MHDRETKLPVPQDFGFPFEPYTIQADLMRQLFSVIESKQIGIFESPTGTGKTLTLTCSALTWLVQHEAALEKELKVKVEALRRDVERKEAENAKSRDWIDGQYDVLQEKQKLAALMTEMDKMKEYYERIEKIKGRVQMKKELNKTGKKADRTEDFEVERDGDDEFMINEDDLAEIDEEERVGDSRFRDTKIFFCSRTHSQLSQVVKEVKRTVFEKETRMVSLASRQSYCINPEVLALRSNTLINEKCLELQKNKAKPTLVDANQQAAKKTKLSGTRCPFYNQGAIEDLKNESVAAIMDIEELATLAKSHKACPYYSTRLAALESQIVMVPYPMILHKRTREQLGIDIRGSVLIIDEAHNLIDTISAIHSAEISLERLVAAKEQLDAYKARYLPRFHPKTALKLNQLVFTARRLIAVVKAMPPNDTKMVLTVDLITEAELFDINLVELIKFAENTRLAHKVHGCAVQQEKRKFMARQKAEAAKSKGDTPKSKQQGLKTPKQNPKSQGEQQQSEFKGIPNSIRPFFSFLECLLEDFEDGRVIVSTKSECPPFLKYLVLNPGAHFKEINDNCRAVILAGGTMQPITDFTEQLFADQRARLKVHSYGHVVPADAVLPLAISKGPSGREFVFNFANKENKDLLQELSSALVNICNVVPAGVVCFFASYDTLDTFHSFFQAHGFAKRLEMKKRIFVETRKGPPVETLLAQYAKAIKYLKNNTTSAQNGALLLSVVGGKLSEGLNFSDDLGRCVVVVGLPYPNKSNPELLEKMKYLDSALRPGAGNEYYENLCMKAVNQSIGRAVRHINDYASVILLDSRYAQARIRKKLPKWIENNLQVVDSFGKGQPALVKFFRSKASS